MSDPLRLWRPTGAVPDEAIGPDCEGALVDESGEVVAAIYPEGEPVCQECGILVRLHED